MSAYLSLLQKRLVAVYADVYRADKKATLDAAYTHTHASPTLR